MAVQLEQVQSVSGLLHGTWTKLVYLEFIDFCKQNQGLSGNQSKGFDLTQDYTLPYRKNNLFWKFGVYLFVNQKKHLSWLELLVVLLDWNLMGLQVWEKEKFLSEKEKRTIAKLSLQDSWFLSNV